MLLSFSVKNFRSFGEQQVLSMVASPRITDHPRQCATLTGAQFTTKALRAAVLYGANAAGKSNIVLAMQTAQEMLLGRRRIFALAPFRFDEAYEQQPTEFEFQFFTAETAWSYGFSVLHGEVLEEWLYHHSSDDISPVFTRTQSQVNIGEVLPSHLPDVEKLGEFLQTLVKLGVRKTQLFLSKIGEQEPRIAGKAISSVFSWLTKSLVIGDRSESSILERLQNEKPFSIFAKKFLEYVGTGISELEVIEKEDDPAAYPSGFLRSLQDEVYSFGTSSDLRVKNDKIIRRNLIAQHQILKNTLYPLPFTEESRGTIRLLELMPALYSLANEDLTFVIDEFDSSLHPLLCREFIRFFGDACPHARSQLIITTHEANLLDQDLLRRDEYWFVEKDERQQSQLVSLAEYQIRNDLQIQKGYLQGRFSAIPIFGNPDSLIRLLGEATEHCT